MAIKTQQLKSIFDQGHSLVDLLPYIDYQDGTFILADGSLGKIWQVAMREAEGREDEHIAALSVHMQNLFNRLPASHIACQMIIVSDRDIGQYIKTYENFTEHTPGTDLFRKGKVDYIRSQPEGFFQHNGQSFNTRKIRLFMTLRFFPIWKNPSLWDQMWGWLHPRFQEQHRQMEEFRQGFQKHISLVEGVFQAGQMTYQSIDQNTLVQWLYPWLNPRRSRQIPPLPVNSAMPLRNQLLFSCPQVTEEGFVFEGIPTNVISLKELPMATQAGMFSREICEAARFCLLDAGTDLMMTINFTVPSLQQAMSSLNLQKSFAFLHQDNWLGDKAIEAVEKKKETDELIAEIYKGEQRVVHARIHFVVRAEDKNTCSGHADNIVNLLNRRGCGAFKEDMIGASLFLTCLPLNFDPYYEQFIKRVKRLASPNAADMMPLLGSFQGTRTPAQMYFNRRGEPVFVDFFDSNINPHGVVIGASGAGKSFFMNDFIVQNERLGAHFFVLDKGDSYKKLCSILGGQYMAFDINHPVTINPFLNEPTPENLSFLMSLLSQMASGGDERDRLNREEEGLLQKAVLQAYEIKDREITLSDVAAVLNNSKFNDQNGINSVMGPTLALRLMPFTRKGPYGGFFDGPNQFAIQGRFTVFELANLSAYADLQLAVLLNLMFFMTNFVSREDMRPKRKFLLIDEAWSLLRVKNTADFITNAFKTFRKYRCSVVAITQEIVDLTRQESGIAIVANACNKVFLKQEAVVVDMLKEKLSLDEATIAVLKTVETVKGKFSEALVMTDSCKGIVRLIPDPFLYWAANSEPRNNDYLYRKIQQENLDILEALKLCAKEHPYGLV